MLIDSHAHLDYPYEKSVPELLASAKAAGVEGVIAIAAAPDSLERVRELAETYPNVYFTSGIHPHDSNEFSDEILARIENLLAHPKCVAVGELGLDYFYDHSDPVFQAKALNTQLALSIKLGKPIIVHTRDADDDTVKFLTPHARDFLTKHPGKVPGVIHCFTGSANLAKSLLDLGYFISFSGIITFKNAEPLREVVREIVPMDKILVETDSPFLAPIPFRGKKNEPAHTRVVAEKVAELKAISLEEVARITKENTLKLFGLKSI